MNIQNRFWTEMKRVYAAYDRMMEKQGFYVVMGICVLVILLSALYTFSFHKNGQLPEENMQTSEELVSAGSIHNTQTLAEAQSLIASRSAVAAVPTETPVAFVQPAAGFVERDFSILEPQYFAQANYWRVHPGMDFDAAYGAVVQACADGKVINIWEDAEKGLCVRIQHADGYESVYAGLSDASYLNSGDPVSRGETIGHVGNGVLAEADAGPHLHFEVWKGNTAVDPVILFLGLDQ